MEPLTTTHLIATGLVFVVSAVFAMLGLGGGMLYVPVFKWLELPLKTVAIPLGLLLNGVTSASACHELTARAYVRVLGDKHVCMLALG